MTRFLDRLKKSSHLIKKTFRMNSMLKRLLYIDDNATNLEVFKETFSEFFEVITSVDPLSVFNHLEGQKFDAVILDVHMPRRDGFQILKEIRESRFSSLPVLMFTSDEMQVTRLEALNAMASDVIYRTLGEEEIKIRILNKINLFSQINEKEKHLTLSTLRLNIETLEAYHCETNLNLTPIEFKILASLIKNFPEKISRESMVKKAWNQESVLDRTVNTHLTNLRNKLPKDEFVIESPRGTGIVLKKNLSHSVKSIYSTNVL